VIGTVASRTEVPAPAPQEGGRGARGAHAVSGWIRPFDFPILACAESTQWDKKVRNYLAFLHLACTYITYRQAGLLG
jgi:hypothetical protein